MNLANTIPAILAPGIAVASLDPELVQSQLGYLFIAASAAAVAASISSLWIRRVR
jgi:hypothetical protein